MITANQLQKVLDQLPPLDSVIGEYYRVIIPEPFECVPHLGGRVPNKKYRYIEFIKHGGEWAIASMPDY